MQENDEHLLNKVVSGIVLIHGMPGMIISSIVLSFVTAFYALITAIMEQTSAAVVTAIIVNIGPPVCLLIGVLVELAKQRARMAELQMTLASAAEDRKHKVELAELDRRERVHDLSNRLQTALLQLEEARLEQKEQRVLYEQRIAELEGKLTALGVEVGNNTQQLNRYSPVVEKIEPVIDHVAPVIKSMADSGHFPAMRPGNSTTAGNEKGEGTK